MDTPKISVIMTTFERPKALYRAIKSVHKQFFQDWELIIVNDKSADNGKTDAVINEWIKKDSRIRVINRSSNFGTHTRPKNEGIKAARASLIAYLDDDNEYRRDHLQVLHQYMVEKYDHKFDIVYGDRMLVDDTGFLKGKKTHPGIRREFDLQFLSKKNYIDTSDVLVKKQALEDIHGWDEELPKYADWNLWIRLAKAGYKFKRVPIIITDYHVHKDCNSFKHPQEIDPRTGTEYPTFSPDGCKIVNSNETFGEAKPLKVAIFTLTMDRLDYTKIMHESMVRTAGYDFDWFVVDNGSKDGTPEWLKDKGTIHLNEKNVGISHGSNQALDMIGEDYDLIMKVDNDCEFVTDNWLKDLVQVFEAQRNMVISPRVEGLRDSPGGVPRTQYMHVGDYFFGLAPHLGGISVIASAQVYKDFRWVTNDFLHGEQDYTFSQYCIDQGYMLVYMEDHIVEHMYGTSGQEERDPEYWERRKVEKVTKYEQD